MLHAKGDSLLIVVAYILEQGINFPPKMRELSVFGLLICPLALMCIILTNGYKGIVTTEVLAPTFKTQLETLEEVLEVQSPNGDTLGILYELEEDGAGAHKCLYMQKCMFNRCVLERVLLNPNQFLGRHAFTSKKSRNDE